MSTLVSIIVPTYNRAGLLREAIESVINQEYQDWQLIVADDGSTDDSEKIVRQYQDDLRVLYFKQDNRGQAAARNLGISHASGDLIAFLDSDNRWLPHKLAAQVSYMDQHPNVDVLYGETERIDGSGRTWPGPIRRRFSGIVWKELLVDNFVTFNTSVVRSGKLRAVGGMDDTVRRGDDYDLWLRLARDSVFHFLPGVVTQYRVEGSRISDDVDGRMQSNLAAVGRFIRSNPGLLGASERRKIKARVYARFARAMSSAGRTSHGISLAMRAVASAPLSLRSWRTLLAVCAMPLRRTMASGLEPAGPSGDG